MKKKLFTFLVLCIFGYYFLPSLIHKVYRLNTSTETIAYNNNLYHSTTNSIHQNKSKDFSKKDSLFLWFHVRGLPIDEDHFASTKYEEWKEIIMYLKNH
ncbi:hypothetical protein JAO71_12790 [Olleya sp. YSTF-M6]|uniref:Uncharacterized protein n=1 Tax=Olleya sediminilitoris TaxID=2795739 RepID=A0ABS1WNJ6_9FLAO|nr:hypothetical protein [Olleya sediminilitoris]MBL7560677.1 hypothetical protein [Olleya sediminilitoris]